MQRQARAKKPANSALVPRTGKSLLASECVVGPAGTRTPNQAVMKQVALRTIRDKISASKRKGLWVGGIGAKSLSKFLILFVAGVAILHKLQPYGLALF